MTTAADAKRLAIVAVACTATLAVVRRVAAGDPPDVVRVTIGAFGAAFALTLAAELAPELVGPFAVLVLVAGVIAAGPGAFRALRDVLGDELVPGASSLRPRSLTA